MRREDFFDYRYTKEAQGRDLKIIWKCDKCGRTRESYPGINEDGQCFCGGDYDESGESYKSSNL